MEDILAPTYGIMLYQEQVMQVAQRYAGLALEGRYVTSCYGEKNAAEMHRMEESFIQGALEKVMEKNRLSRFLLSWKNLLVMVSTDRMLMLMRL